MNQHWLMVDLQIYKFGQMVNWKEPEMEQKIGNFIGSENIQNVAEMRILRWMTDGTRMSASENQLKWVS